MGELYPEKGRDPSTLSLLVRELVYPLRRHRSLERQEEVFRAAVDYLEAGYPSRPYFFHGLIEVVQSQGRLDEAAALLDTAQAEVDELGGTEEVGVALRGLRGLLFARMGLPDRAAPLVQEAFEYQSARLDDPRQEVNPGFLLSAYQTRSDLLMSADRYEELVLDVESLLEHAELFERHGAVRAGLRVRLGIAYMELAAESQGSMDSAAEALRRALDEPDLEDRDRLRATTRLAFLGLLGGEIEEARKLARESRWLVGEWTPDSDVPAVQAAFLAALEVRIAAATGEDLPVGLLERLRRPCDALLEEWREVVPRAGGLGLARYLRERFALAELVVATERADGALAALDLVFRVQSVGSLTRLLEGPRTSADDVRRELLGPAHGLLAYFPGRDRLLAFALDDERVSFAAVHVTPDAFDTADPDVLLPAPIAAHVESWEHVAIVGHDALGGLALEALPLPDGGLLGDLVAISYLPSVSVGRVLAARPDRPKRSAVCLVTNAVHGAEVQDRHPGIRELTMSPGEIDALVAAHVPGSVRILTGDDATLARAVEAGSDARVLHLFTHGIRDPARDVSAGLVLSPDVGHDGTVWSEDLLEIAAPSLVVVTACGSGSGPQRVGDAESSHLGAALLRAGAVAAVVADTDLDQVEAHRLMTAFHRELALGVSVAEALRRARVELAEDDAVERHRTLVHVVGLGHLPVFDPPSPVEEASGWPWGWVLGCALAAIAVYVAVRRRA